MGKVSNHGGVSPLFHSPPYLARARGREPRLVAGRNVNGARPNAGGGVESDQGRYLSN